MQDFQALILETAIVQLLRRNQQADGWIGSRFHGFDSLEGSIRQMCELGLSPSDHPLKGAIQALQSNEKRITTELGHVGRLLDAAGLGGTQTICAALLAQAGYEELSLVQSQVRSALDVFESVLEVDTLADICLEYHGKLVFRPYRRLPSIYHLRLLSFTRCWRSPLACLRLSQALSRLASLSPIPQVHLKYKSQLIAPASFGMQDFNMQIKRLSASQWMVWFQQAELLTRLGIASLLPSLQDQLASLNEILAHEGGWFRLPVNHPYFQRWGAYTGLRLEGDWKSPQRRLNDLTFRSLLIKHMAAYSFEKVSLIES